MTKPLTAEMLFADASTDIYGVKVIATPSRERESVLFLALGHDLDRRRLTAVVSLIRRTFGYHDLLGRSLDNFFNIGYAVGTIVPPVEGEEFGSVDIDVGPEKRVGSVPVTWGEF